MRTESEQVADRLMLLKYLQLDPLQVEVLRRTHLLTTRILAIQLWHMTCKKPYLFSYKFIKEENAITDDILFSDLESLLLSGCINHLQITRDGEDLLFEFEDWISQKEETRLAHAIAYVHEFTSGALEVYVNHHPIVLATKIGQEVII